MAFQSYSQHSQGAYGNSRPSAPPAPEIDVSKIKFAQPLDPELFADIAQAAAKAIAEEGRGKKNKSTQLRKFYDELVMWHDKVFFEQGEEAKAAKYTALAPFIKMMRAKAAYAKGRDHVSAGFEKLFSHLIGQVKTPDTLRDAKLFMEAFMGFYKAEEK
jgi:CRISPR-associated protein Csm2